LRGFWRAAEKAVKEAEKKQAGATWHVCSAASYRTNILALIQFRSTFAQKSKLFNTVGMVTLRRGDKEKDASNVSLSSLLEEGMRIYVAGSVNEPTAVLDALANEHLAERLHFIQFPLGGYNQCDFTALNDSAEMTTVFMTAHLKNADPDRLHFIPMQMRAVFDYLAHDIDAVLVQVARNRSGQLCIGPNVDFIQSALSGARVVIAELNHSFVAPAGCPVFDEGRIDLIIESNRSLYEMPPPVIDEAARAIGRHVAELIADGDCLQTGIGAIPAAILAELDQKNDIGMHGGLLDDGGMHLIKAGNVTSSRKQIDMGVHVTGMALGSKNLIDWLSDTPQVSFRGADYTHEVSVIRQLDNFVSINSAIEIDLAGQVNAEVAGGRQISGTGGSVDFMRSAKASKNGRSIIAMNASARGGSVSRIVRKVDTVTALRTDVDIVVTEYGVAHLANLSLDERAVALRAIATPAFRAELEGGG
jgi:4-hydroxybutyrate CoA-transferase